MTNSVLFPEKIDKRQNLLQIRLLAAQPNGFWETGTQFYRCQEIVFAESYLQKIESKGPQVHNFVAPIFYTYVQ